MALNGIIVQRFVKKSRMHSSLNGTMSEVTVSYLRVKKLFENEKETVLSFKESRT